MCSSRNQIRELSCIQGCYTQLNSDQDQSATLMHTASLEHQCKDSGEAKTRRDLLSIIEDLEMTFSSQTFSNAALFFCCSALLSCSALLCLILATMDAGT